MNRKHLTHTFIWSFHRELRIMMDLFFFLSLFVMFYFIIFLQLRVWAGKTKSSYIMWLCGRFFPLRIFEMISFRFVKKNTTVILINVLEISAAPPTISILCEENERTRLARLCMYHQTYLRWTVKRLHRHAQIHMHVCLIRTFFFLFFFFFLQIHRVLYSFFLSLSSLLSFFLSLSVRVHYFFHEISK